jgi:hypothetical protein
MQVSANKSESEDIEQMLCSAAVDIENNHKVN